MVFLICDITNLSNVFMMIGVRALSLKSLRQVTVWAFGTGMMVDVLRRVGTVAWQGVVGGALCILLVVIGKTLNALPRFMWVIRDEMLLYFKSIVRFCCCYAGCQASPCVPECV